MPDDPARRIVRPAAVRAKATVAAVDAGVMTGAFDVTSGPLRRLTPESRCVE